MQSILKRSVLVLIIGLLVLVACQSDESPTAVPATTPAAQVAATSAAATSPLSAAESPLAAASTSPLPTPVAIAEGRSRVKGRLLSEDSGQPLVKDVVRLGEIYCPEDVVVKNKSEECFWALDNAFSPSTFTDEDGFYVFEDVEARDFVIIIGDLIGKHAFVNDENGKPVIITAPIGETVDVGEYAVAY